MAFRSFFAAVLIMVAALGLRAGPAEAQRSQADCAPGWVFANGQCQEPGSGPPSSNSDATCQATAQFRPCQISVYVGCNSYRNAYACRLLQLSQRNPGMFQQIMNAQRACMTGNGQACGYLQKFRGTYF